MAGTLPLAAMNMAIRGIDFNFGKEPANTYTNDQHPDLRADFVMANPPFNMKELDTGVDDNYPRWVYGRPPSGNANFAWLQHMLYHLAPNGSMGLLLANGSMSSNTSGEGEIRTLKSAEWAGGHVMPTGDALLSGYYLNELLMRLLARDDPHAAVFDVYRQTVKVLSSGLDNTTAPLLRAFELLLLQDIGLLPDLSVQTLTLQPLLADKNYALLAETGLGASAQAPSLRGQQWLQLHSALASADALTVLLRVCAEWPSEERAALQIQLRNLLHYHCGVNSLRTRQVMMELQAL